MGLESPLKTRKQTSQHGSAQRMGNTPPAARSSQNPRQDTRMRTAPHDADIASGATAVFRIIASDAGTEIG